MRRNHIVNNYSVPWEVWFNFAEFDRSRITKETEVIRKDICIAHM